MTYRSLDQQNSSIERNDAPPNRRIILERRALRRQGLNYHSQVARKLSMSQGKPRPPTMRGDGPRRNIFVSYTSHFPLLDQHLPEFSCWNLTLRIFQCCFDLSATLLCLHTTYSELFCFRNDTCFDSFHHSADFSVLELRFQQWSGPPSWRHC